MTNKDKILQSIYPVVENSKFVKINLDAIKEFSATINERDLFLMEFSTDQFLKDRSPETQIGFIILFQSLNFCFWGEPKWSVADENGKMFGGSFGMIFALKKAIEQGINLLDAKVLKNISLEDAKKIFASEVEIPMLKERHLMINRLGYYLEDRFGGTFESIIAKANYDAGKIVDTATQEMPTVFGDEAMYHGRKVFFYKRAQLISHHLFKLNQLGLLQRTITNLEDLTALADYKAPQMLRKHGILEYSPGLGGKVDNKVEIVSGSDEEIEIRANMIQAFELITEELRPRFSDVMSFTINDVLWIKSQDKSQQDRPYHRTETVWY